MNMNKKYTEIDCCSLTLEDVVIELIELSIKNNGELFSCEFNGKILYSDTISLDNAYQTITNRSYAEIKERERKNQEAYQQAEEEHKIAIPLLTEEWITKGHKILTQDKWELWDKIVPIRLNDLYHGMELGCCLELVKMLNNNSNFADVKEAIENQNHSGMSWSLVCAMVREFSPRGADFCEYVN